MGRSSGHTWGVIHDPVVRVNVFYDGVGTAAFDDQILVRPEGDPSESAAVFALPGDSGALVLADGNFAVGLLFAVNTIMPNRAWLNPIGGVLRELGVETWNFGW